MNLIIKKVILAASIAFTSLNSYSAVIIDTGMSTGSAATIFETSADNFQKLAGKFVLETGFNVTDILASLSYLNYAKPTASLNISVFSDLNNTPQNTLFSGQVTLNSSGYDSWVGLNNISLDLDAGSYWIVFSGIKGESQNIGWSMYGATNPLPSYKMMNGLNGYPYQWLNMGSDQSPGLRILGTPLATVPEPENLAMLYAGLGLVGIAARRNKRARA